MKKEDIIKLLKKTLGDLSLSPRISLGQSHESILALLYARQGAKDVLEELLEKIEPTKEEKLDTPSNDYVI